MKKIKQESRVISWGYIQYTTDSISKPWEEMYIEDKQNLLIHWWNSSAEKWKVPTIEKLNMIRISNIYARITENDDYDYWIRVFKNISESMFLKTSSWFDFNWIFQTAENTDRIWEGHRYNKIKKTGW